MEADARLLNKKFRRTEAENYDRKSEETRLIVINKSLKKAVDKHQKEAHRLLFSMNRKEGSVSSTEKKIKIDFRALKVKFEKAMKEMKKLEKANKTLKTKNEVLKSDVTLKKAEIDFKKEAFKMDLAKIAFYCQTLNKEAKICADKQKAELALEHLHAKMASTQAKKDADAAHKAKAIKDKHDEFDKMKQCSIYFESNMVSFIFS